METVPNAILFIGLIGIASVLTFFAFKTTAVLFRLSGAIGWLVILLYVLKYFDITEHWVVALFMALFCIVWAIMLLYMGKTIDNAWMVNKEKDIRPLYVQERAKRQESKQDYRAMLHERISRGSHSRRARGIDEREREDIREIRRRRRKL